MLKNDIELYSYVCKGKTRNITEGYFIQKNPFNLGKVTDNFNGVSLAVYDRFAIVSSIVRS